MNHRLPIAVLLLALLSNAWGDVGATREQCDRLYGQPLAVHDKAEWNYPVAVPPQLPGAATQVCVYAFGTNGHVTAYFRPLDNHLVCVALYLTVHGPADQAVKQFLKSAPANLRWRNTSPDWKPRGFNYRVYTRSDGKAAGYCLTRPVRGQPTLELALYDPANW